MHLAQLNIAKLKHPLDAPETKDFTDNLDMVNRLAEKSPGFVWRFETDEGNATAAEQPFGDDFIVNMSTWTDVDSLKNFVYKTIHKKFVQRRAEWFEEVEIYTVMWWVADGYEPTVKEASERLEMLRKDGPSQSAFGFANLFDPG